MKAIFAVALGSLCLTGCLGYHIGPVKPYYLRDVHTLAVPTFTNRTLVPRIEVLVTNTVIKQFQQDGTFQIVGGEDADATLKDGKPISGASEVIGTTSFFVGTDVTTDERQALPLATEELATRLVSQLSEGW